MAALFRTALAIAVALVVILGGCRKEPPSEPASTEQLSNAKGLAPVASLEGKTDSIEWMTDFEAAKKKAADEGKDILINFTGSDWCGWCIRLDKEVFNQKMFASEAPTRFVMVKIDFPRKTSLPVALQKQNDRLAEAYQVQGFPTIVLADSTGKPYAQTGYEEGGPMVYLQHLAQLRLQRPAK